MNGTSDTISVLGTLRTCGICQNVCSDPRSLECLHTFCLDCLKEKLVEHADSFHCPVCSIEIRIPAGCSVGDFLSTLQPNAIFSEAGQSDMYGIVACRKHPNYECKYFYTDNLQLACDVCRYENSEFCDVLTPDVIANIRCERQATLGNTVSATKNELNDICNELRSREKSFLTKNDEIVLGVMKYFMDLRVQINEYLFKHEKDVLKKLEDLTEGDLSNTVMSMKYCKSLLESLDSNFSHLVKPTALSGGNEMSNIHLFDILQLHAEEYLAKAKTVKQAQLNDTGIRFIINTEFEDMLTTGDLIDIEIENQQQQSSVLTELQVSTSQNTQTNIIGLDTEANDQRNGEIIITVTPPPESVIDELNDDPPPPYPGFQDLTEISNEQQDETSARLISAPPGSTGVLPSAPPESTRVLPSASHESTRVSSSLPSYDFSSPPLVPRGLTHGFEYEPGSPLGESRDRHHLSLTALGKFRLYVPGQLNNPTLADLSWIDDDKLLILDKKNKSMSVMTKKGYFCSGYNFSEYGEPYSCVVYTLTGINVVVTCPKQRRFVFCTLNDADFRVKPQPIVTPTTKGYTYIRFDKNIQKFVCCSTSPFSLPCIDLLDKNGVFLRSFNGSDIRRLGYPRAVQPNSKNTIAISDYKTSSVTLMSSTGRQNGLFTGEARRKLNDPQGIGFSEKLNLFVVADTRANRIFFIDSQGFPHDSFSESSLIGNTPRFVAFSPSYNPVLAIGHGNGYISIYKVNTLDLEQTYV